MAFPSGLGRGAMAKDLSRRDLLVGSAYALSAATGIASSSGLAAPAVKSGGKKPNILFIPIDDMNDWTGWQGGYPLASTPNLDALAGKGAAMTRAYAPVPVCQGSRAAVMFGIEPWRSGIYTNHCKQWPKVKEVAKRPSLVRTFQEAGYRTFGTGKIHHDGWQNDDKGNDPSS